MKPILIFNHGNCAPPGYIATLLDSMDYAYHQVCMMKQVDEEIHVLEYAAVVIMGGPGDVNQPEDWMRREIDLVRLAYQQDIPLLGICLGAQMMSVIMGGRVEPAETVEVGWHNVELTRFARGHHCFKELPKTMQVFHWHAHVCIPPQDMPALAYSQCTEYQAFAKGPHLALQFHLEMDEQIIRSLIDLYGSDLQGDSPCVQNEHQVLADIDSKCQVAFDIADSLIGKWFLQLNKTES